MRKHVSDMVRKLGFKIIKIGNLIGPENDADKERRFVKGVRAMQTHLEECLSGRIEDSNETMQMLNDWRDNARREARMTALEQACRTVKPFESDGMDEIELTIRALASDEDRNWLERVKLEAVLSEAREWMNHTGYDPDDGQAYAWCKGRIDQVSGRLAALSGEGKEPK